MFGVLPDPTRKKRAQWQCPSCLSLLRPFYAYCVAHFKNHKTARARMAASYPALVEYSCWMGTNSTPKDWASYSAYIYAYALVISWSITVERVSIYLEVTVYDILLLIENNNHFCIRLYIFFKGKARVFIIWSGMVDWRSTEFPCVYTN